MEIPLRKKAATLTIDEMERLVYKFLDTSTAKEILISTKDSSIFARWKSGPTLGEFHNAIPNLNHWAVIGTSELVGRYQLSEGRSRYNIVTERKHSLSELSLAAVRFRNSKNRTADTNIDTDLRELFDILEGTAAVGRFQLADLMSSALLERTQKLYDFEATTSELEVLKNLCTYLERVSYDTLWNEAFSRIK